METMVSPLRDQGLQALREGSVDAAVDLLTRVVMANGDDAEAQMFLGVAYSQKGLHPQARRALQTAVDLRPQEARYHFNLAAALEQAGDVNGAVSAYRHALQISPGHEQARARLRALAPQLSNVVAGAASATEAVNGGPAADEAPWQRGWTALTDATTTGPAGTIQCPGCRQWSKPGLSCEWCSAPLKSAPSQPAAPWLQPDYAGAEQMVLPGTAVSAGPGMGVGEAFVRRFAACFIDGIIVQMMCRPAGFALGAAMGSSGADRLTILVAGFAIGILIGTIYYAGMLSVRGQTVGKMAMGLRVIGPDGGNPGFWSAALREDIGKLISFAAVGLGYLGTLWDGEQQTWHDKIAGTCVVRA